MKLIYGGLILLGGGFVAVTVLGGNFLSFLVGNFTLFAISILLDWGENEKNN